MIDTITQTGFLREAQAANVPGVENIAALRTLLNSGLLERASEAQVLSDPVERKAALGRNFDDLKDAINKSTQITSDEKRVKMLKELENQDQTIKQTLQDIIKTGMANQEVPNPPIQNKDRTLLENKILGEIFKGDRDLFKAVYGEDRLKAIDSIPAAQPPEAPAVSKLLQRLQK